MTTEEDIIKKRLLIEGDSGNEDRLINKLTKTFVKWSSLAANESQQPQTNGQSTTTTTPATTDDENIDNLYEQMILSLSNAEFSLLRNHFIYEMNKVEQENYHVLYEKINAEIEKAKKKIVESKLELQEARKIRKNRQEYDVLARQIQNYPDRSEMALTIKSLEDKVEHLKKVDAEYGKKIDLRRKQFSVVLQSLSSLKCLIDTDLKPEDILNSTLNMNETLGAVNENEQANFKQENQPANGKLVDEDMDDEQAESMHNLKREKHYSVSEVDMEDTA